MPSTTDQQLEIPGLFALFKGDNGSGKTEAALSFPTPYVFDHDRKMPAIARKHYPGKKIDWDPMNNIFEVEEKVKQFKDFCPYETLITDTITSASYGAIKTIDDVKGQNIFSMLQNISVKEKQPSASSRVTRSGQDAKKEVKTIELRGYDYYNGEDSFFKWYIDELKALWARPGNPKHVLVLAHILMSEQSGPPGSTLKTITRRIVTAGNKIAAYIPAQFDEVYHFAVDQGSAFDQNAVVKHFCFTQGVGDDFAKTAYNLPPAFDFTWELGKQNKGLYDLISDKVDIGRPKTL